MFIDTHCHLIYDDCNRGNVDAVIAHAMDAGIGKLVCATADTDDFAQALEIANTHTNVFCTIGMHPDCAGQNPDDFITKQMLQNPRVVGVGEIGLDYHERDDNKPAQIALFERQLELARDAGLPVAIHTRNAEQDTANILAKFTDTRGVMHCFTSSWELARIMLDRGFYFSASGILTFKNAADIRETFAKIPNDRIVIETDSPYCAPVPYRGKVCEPAFVIETARVLAEIKNLSLDKLEIILEQNTYTLYPKLQ